MPLLRCAFGFKTSSTGFALSERAQRDTARYRTVGSGHCGQSVGPLFLCALCTGMALSCCYCGTRKPVTGSRGLRSVPICGSSDHMGQEMPGFLGGRRRHCGALLTCLCRRVMLGCRNLYRQCLRMCTVYIAKVKPYDRVRQAPHPPGSRAVAGGASRCGSKPLRRRHQFSGLRLGLMLWL